MINKPYSPPGQTPGPPLNPTPPADQPVPGANPPTRSPGPWLALVALGVWVYVLIECRWMLRLEPTALAAGNLFSVMRGSWEFPAKVLMGLLGGAAVLFSVTGIGYLALAGIPGWRRVLPTITERLVLAPLVGAVPFSLVILGAGLAGFGSPAACEGLLAGGLVIGALGWRMLVSEWRTKRKHALPASHPPFTVFLWVLIGLLALLIVPYTLSPAVESDELRYHLAAPATWLRDGRIHTIPHQAFSNFPFLAEMLFMAAMAVGGGEAAKLVHLGVAPVCVGLVALLTRRWIGERRRDSTALATGLVFALIPSVPIIAAWGFIAMFVAAYFLAFVYVTGRSLAQPSRGSAGLVGVIAAGALGTKYSLVPLVGVLGIVWLIMRWRQGGPGKALRALATVVIVDLLLAGPWYVKNLVWTGNPVYPGAHSVFGGGEWSAENTALFLRKAGDKGMHLNIDSPLRGPLEFLISPFTTLFHPDKFGFHFTGPLPLMGAVLVVCWIIAWAMGGGGRAIRTSGRAAIPPWWIVLALIGSWGLWFVTYQSIRFLLPTLGLALAAGGVAWSRWMRAPPNWMARLAHILLIVAVLMCFNLTFTILGSPSAAGGAGKTDAIATGLGFQRPEHYLARRLKYYRAAQWLGRHAGPGEKALLVGEHRTLHFPLPIVASDWFDTPQPLPWVRRTPDNDRMLDVLLREGIRYIFYNKGELDLYRASDFIPRMSQTEYERIETLWDHPRLTMIHQSPLEGILIYEIAPTDS